MKIFRLNALFGTALTALLPEVPKIMSKSGSESEINYKYPV